MSEEKQVGKMKTYEVYFIIKKCANLFIIAVSERTEREGDLNCI